MGNTDPLVTMLTTLRTALLDRDTWSLEPLAEICSQAIELRQKQLGTLPPKSISQLRHDSDEPIILEVGDVWP